MHLLARIGGSALLALALMWTLASSQGTDVCHAPCVPGDYSIMRPKEHGTSHVPVQQELRWNCDRDVADTICNYNRRWAEHSGYWHSKETTFLEELDKSQSLQFYDSNTGRLLFRAPVDRTWDDWLDESTKHGWPSFRDAEVNWDYVRVLPNGETVSVDGTHLGHNLPDHQGNRFCINLVSIAGRPVSDI